MENGAFLCDFYEQDSVGAVGREKVGGAWRSFFGFGSGSTCGEEWSDCGRMEPVRRNGRETGLRFQPDGGQGAGLIFGNIRRFIEGSTDIKLQRLA